MDRAVLPWTVAAVSALVAVVSLVKGRSGGAPAELPPVEAQCDANDLARLRRNVATAENENRFLRAEMDRMRAMLEQKKASDKVRKEWDGGVELTEEQRKEKLAVALQRLPELAQRLVTGEKEVYEGMREVVHSMLNAPMDDPTLFREAYDRNDDATVRRLVLPHIVARDPTNARAFLMQELRSAENPDLRTDILSNLRFATKVAEDAEAQQVLVSALEKESEPRARQAAVDILSTVAAPEVQEALLKAAGADPDEHTREVAIRTLAANPQTRERVLELTANVSDERLRTIGECTARLATYNENP